MRNRRAGFTIIEVAIVCVLIGLLTLIALPALTSHREKAQKATMKSDLHQLVLAQENHFDTYGTYAGVWSGDIDDQDGALGRDTFQPSAGVTVQIWYWEASPSGWAATASYPDIPTLTGCAVFVGPADPYAAAVSLPLGTPDGVAVCQ